MTRERFEGITSCYRSLKVAVVGDFVLDRYFDIDLSLQEVSLETGLPVHNVVSNRCAAGAAGTVLNNLSALGVGAIWPVGFCGDDAEGWELRRALRAKPQVVLDHFLTTPERKTFTYTKPLLHRLGCPPEELSRLDQKNWTPTPRRVSEVLVQAVGTVAAEADVLMIMEQIDLEGTGVVTREVLDAVSETACARPALTIVADSRRGLRDYPKVIFKMNGRELASFSDATEDCSLDEVRRRATLLSKQNSRPVLVTLAERGIVGAEPSGQSWHCPSRPIRGPIDVVGAGDCVTPNAAIALAAGATIPEAMELAMAGANIVIHQLGTTGTASVAQIGELLFGAGSAAL